MLNSSIYKTNAIYLRNVIFSSTQAAHFWLSNRTTKELRFSGILNPVIAIAFQNVRFINCDCLIWSQCELKLRANICLARAEHVNFQRVDFYFVDMICLSVLLAKGLRITMCSHVECSWVQHFFRIEWMNEFFTSKNLTRHPKRKLIM